jgi:beta-galactosamide-alpha-2,3-sialyltransferase
MKNLFICMSPLQILVSVKIIEKLHLKKENCELFFYCYNQNKIIKHYVNINEKFFFKVNIFTIKKKFPHYIYKLKKFFIKKKYNYIFLANVNGLIDQFVLSFSNFSEIFTFSEGSSDTYNYENFYKKNFKIEKNFFFFFKEFIYCCMGKMYTNKIILQKRKFHFTFYQNDLAPKNIIKKITSPFQFVQKTKLKKKRNIVLVLGTVLEDLEISKKDLLNLRRKFEFFLLKLTKKYKNKSDVYYLPHPRSKTILFNNKNIKVIKTNLIAEDLIHQKIKSGFVIKEIYCFLFSSVLLHKLKLKFTIYDLPGLSQSVLNESKKQYPKVTHIKI